MTRMIVVSKKYHRSKNIEKKHLYAVSNPY